MVESFDDPKISMIMHILLFIRILIIWYSEHCKKTVVAIDLSRHSISPSYVTRGLISSINVSTEGSQIEQASLFEETAIWFFGSEGWQSENCKKCSDFWLISIFRIIFLSVHSFTYVGQWSHRKPYTCRYGLILENFFTGVRSGFFYLADSKTVLWFCICPRFHFFFVRKYRPKSFHPGLTLKFLYL